MSASDDWRAVCRVGDVAVDDVRRFELEGCPALAVFNLEGEFYVTDDRCTHAEASLAEGELDDDVIECPFHGGSFHIPTGEVMTAPPRKPLRTYEVDVSGDEVRIRVPDE
jgi:nitrite reductase/ring-hydroxylating ferredoxin subunit